MPANARSLVAAGALLAASTATADAPNRAVAFGPAIEVSPGGSVAEILVADVTGDGVDDVVRVPGDAAFVSVFPGGGAAAFDAETGVPGFRARVARLNADAAYDLVLDRGDASGVELLLSSGTGGLTRFESPASESPLNALYVTGETPCVADWDGDGNLDVVTLDSSAVLRLRAGDGLGGLGASRTIARLAASWPVYDVAAADFDGDGLVDLALADGAVRFFRRQADGALDAGERLDDAGAGESRALLAADLDGDGRRDLVASARRRTSLASGVETYAARIAVFLHDEAGSFAPAAVLECRGATDGRSIAVADLNGDGRPEIAAPGTLLVNRGDGTFGPPLAVAAEGTRVALGDATGDGRADYVYADGAGVVRALPAVAPPPPPTISSMSPTTLFVGATTDVVLECAGFSADAGLDFGDGLPGARGGREVTLLQGPIATPGALSARVSVSKSAAPGARTLMVVAPDGGAASIPYEVAAGGDCVAWLATPERAHAGERLRVALRGKGFVAGAQASLRPVAAPLGPLPALRLATVEETTFVDERELLLVVSVGWAADGVPQTLTVRNGTGVTSTFDGVFRVAPPSGVVVELRKGVLKPGAGRGSFSASGFLADSVGFDPIRQAAEVRCGDLTAPFVVQIPAGEGWRVRRRGAVWTSPRGAVPRVRFSFDAWARAFRLDVSRATFAPPNTSELGLDVALAGEWGASVRPWAPRSDGTFVLRPEGRR
jgi:hypothetical protein